jgi:hypothetical protein
MRSKTEPQNPERENPLKKVTGNICYSIYFSYLHPRYYEPFLISNIKIIFRKDKIIFDKTRNFCEYLKPLAENVRKLRTFVQ